MLRVVLLASLSRAARYQSSTCQRYCCQRLPEWSGRRDWSWWWNSWHDLYFFEATQSYWRIGLHLFHKDVACLQIPTMNSTQNVYRDNCSSGAQFYECKGAAIQFSDDIIWSMAMLEPLTRLSKWYSGYFGEFINIFIWLQMLGWVSRLITKSRQSHWIAMAYHPCHRETRTRARAVIGRPNWLLLSWSPGK